jgi:serine phosphatase RsbU (regulator of sigma subunit)
MLGQVRGIELVGEAQDLQEAEQLCNLTGPDVVLLDCKSPLDHCKEAALHIRQGHPQLQVVVLVNPQDEQQLLESPEETIACYFSRDISEEEFSAAIQQIGAELLPAFRKNLAEAERPSAPIIVETSSIEATAVKNLRHTKELAQELSMAGEIQAGILPEKEPSLPGWEIAARLLAARETSGDFYDFIQVTNHNWGLVIADVADKGMGAALFMTLTNTLIRSFAPRYPTLPALTLDAVNDRIHSDTRGSMYVTAFFGVLEPHVGRLRYANAGHPPPLLVKNQRSKPVDRLAATGMALGVLENYHWKQKLVSLGIGDVLVLYTDGVLEALNAHGGYFGEKRLQDVVRSQADKSAQVILEAVLAEVQSFTANAPRQDDIALVVILRKA